MPRNPQEDVGSECSDHHERSNSFKQVDWESRMASHSLGNFTLDFGGKKSLGEVYGNGNSKQSTGGVV